MINIILSTYNEAECIVPMVRMLTETLNGIVDKHRIIVVDGGSTDGTSNTVKKLRLPTVIVVEEKCKSGLGSAYVEGLKHCIYEYTFILDADLQHDPFYITEFFKLIRSDEKYDIIIGTRYAKSGMVSNWSFLRRFLSRFSNNLAKYVIGLKSSDLTGSFRCYRTILLKKLLSESKCKGFGIQMEVISRAEKLGSKVGEVPIIFYNRTAGESKYGINELYLFIKTVFKLYIAL
jgi:dolichol-phosphate mannosyltransferase